MKLLPILFTLLCALCGHLTAATTPKKWIGEQHAAKPRQPFTPTLLAATLLLAPLVALHAAADGGFAIRVGVAMSPSQPFWTKLLTE